MNDQKEPLIPLFEDEPQEAPLDITGVVRSLRAIRHYEDHVNKLREERDHLIATYEQWYDKKMAACDDRIAFHRRNLETYLQATKTDKVSTPAGTAFFRTSTIRTWPADEKLVAFSLQSGIPVKMSPDKTKISDFIHSVGEAPEGYREVQEKRLSIRIPGEE